LGLKKNEKNFIKRPMAKRSVRLFLDSGDKGHFERPRVLKNIN